MQLIDASHIGKHYISESHKGPSLTINLEPGQKLLDDRYTIKALLNRGRFGTVYLTDDRIRSEEVALKVAPLVSEDLANQLKQNIELHSKVLDYSHVIRLYDVHTVAYEGVVLLLVSTEYADGGTLRQWLSKNRDNLCKRQTEGPFYFKQVCRGIGALHTAGIVHQNLTPENCLSVKGVLKVSELGFSRCMQNVQNSGYNDLHLDLDVSQGTPEYKAPEQFMAARSGDVDCRADIYALGVILFEICDPQGRPPFEGSYWQLRQRHLDIPAPVLENTGANEARVIARCLQKAPADRYATIAQLIDDLESSSSTAVSQTAQAGTQQSIELIPELWEKTCEFMEKGSLNEAGKLCDRILDIVPGFGQARNMRVEIDNRFDRAKDFYETIRQGIGNQSLDQLSTLVAEAVAIYPAHPDGHLIQTQLVSMAGEYKDAMHKGIKAMGKGHWQQAKVNFKRARELNPGMPRIAELIDFVSEVRQRVEAARAKIDAAIQRGDWNKATSWARAVDEYIECVKERATGSDFQELGL
jgi:serine/threonine protein kinase